MGEERSPVFGKPCLGAMGGEVRLPPGEPCREGEFCPEPGDLASGGEETGWTPGTCGDEKGIHRPLTHSFQHLFIQSFRQSAG